MKRTFLALIIIAVVAGGILGGVCYFYSNRDFSPWMSETEMNLFLQKFNETKPGEEPWKSTHWVTAVQGRWSDGIAQYRIRSAAITFPRATPFAWRYFYKMDQATFSKTIQDLGDQGFALVDYHSFKLPDGTRRYQGVWHKIGSDK